MSKRRVYYQVIRSLRDIRRKQKITQKQLAEATGYGRRTLISWEAFTRTPSLRALEDWCEALGVQLSVKRR
jgi:transcriptional regulator with XRE-family HTH domain